MNKKLERLAAACLIAVAILLGLAVLAGFVIGMAYLAINVNPWWWAALSGVGFAVFVAGIYVDLEQL